MPSTTRREDCAASDHAIAGPSDAASTSKVTIDRLRKRKLAELEADVELLVTGPPSHESLLREFVYLVDQYAATDKGGPAQFPVGALRKPETSDEEQETSQEKEIAEFALKR